MMFPFVLFRSFSFHFVSFCFTSSRLLLHRVVSFSSVSSPLVTFRSDLLPFASFCFVFIRFSSFSFSRSFSSRFVRYHRSASLCSVSFCFPPFASLRFVLFHFASAGLVSICFASLGRQLPFLFLYFAYFQVVSSSLPSSPFVGPPSYFSLLCRAYRVACFHLLIFFISLRVSLSRSVSFYFLYFVVRSFTSLCFVFLLFFSIISVHFTSLHFLSFNVASFLDVSLPSLSLPLVSSLFFHLLLFSFDSSRFILFRIVILSLILLFGFFMCCLLFFAYVSLLFVPFRFLLLRFVSYHISFNPFLSCPSRPFPFRYIRSDDSFLSCFVSFRFFSFDLLSLSFVSCLFVSFR